MAKQEKNVKHKRKKTPVPTLVGCALALAASIGLALFLVLHRPAPESRMSTTMLDNGRAGLPATVCQPGSGENWPLVVLCHGFTGNRGGDGHFAALQQQLAETGIASVAIDFPGCGDSTEDATAYTIANMQSDITAAIAALVSTAPVDTARIGLVGHSMGGRVASLYLAQGAYPVAAAALWSPANAEGLQGLGFLDSGNFERVQQIAAEAQTVGSAAAGSFDFTISGELVNEFEGSGSSPDGILAACGTPLLLCYTGHEDLFGEDAVQATIAAAQQNTAAQVLLDPFVDANHNYAAYDAAQSDLTTQLDEALRSATVDFLKANLL